MDEIKSTEIPVVKYKRTLFFERITFICNIFFLVCVVVRFSNVLPGESIPAFIIILGWVVSFFLNIISMAIKIILLFKDGKLHFPVWITAVNLLSFAAQIFIFFILPG